MSNAMHARVDQRDYRRKLLATASAAVLMISACEVARAEDAGTSQPILWVEGGWHFEKVTGKDEQFGERLIGSLEDNGFISPRKYMNRLAFSYGADGKIIFQPENSDWLLTAAIRYGRAQGYRQLHTEMPGEHLTFLPFGSPAPIPRTQYVRSYSDTTASSAESHVIADFQAGRDVGLGLFSAGSKSTVNFGVRFAQFHSRSSTNISADPHAYAHLKYLKFGNIHGTIPIEHYQKDGVFALSTRSFTGLGPSISWNNSTPLAGDVQEGQLALDWGVNAAVLFGRQKAKTQHQTNMRYYDRYGHLASAYHNTPPPQDRSRRVTVPNLGGFAGVSYRFQDAKLGLGYRADYFFGAIDGGIDARKSETRGFNGPYASISIGLGD